MQSWLKLSPRVFLHTVGITPPWLPEGGIALPQLPSDAFGDGSHPTTRLCSGAVDLQCRLQRPQSLLDVGTGTGVLARIARARGTPFVVATDIDPHAMAAARANMALDQDPSKTLGEILVSNSPPDTWGSRFDLVVANILESPLRELAPSLMSALAPGGTLLLSGFTPLQVPILRSIYTELEYISESTLGEWSLLMFRPIKPNEPSAFNRKFYKFRNQISLRRVVEQFIPEKMPKV